MTSTKPGPARKLTDKERGRRHRELVATRDKAASVALRDIGRPPLIADVRRRNRCRKSLRLFCETYGAEACCWPWSEDHLLVLRSIEQSVFRGAMLAIAMPRGSGKTTLCRLAVLWAVAFGHVGYAFLIGANEEKAVGNLDAIKLWMRELEPFVADFPEISHGIRMLGGIANKASGQLCGGVSTLIRWERTRVVLPRVLKPKNMRWHKGKFAPTSGAVIGVSGLTGEGIRGSLFAHPDGRQVRPDLVLLDDPQTDESARSHQQNVDRLDLIRGAVLGMAGPGARLSAVMPCTVIRPGDMIDQVLDRKKHPLWRGVRTKLLRSMPTNMSTWERYWVVYAECMGRDVPDPDPANAWYLEHRNELDAGTEASWEARQAQDEVSAIQHGMNLYFQRGPVAFHAEYQNAPLDPDRDQGVRLTATAVASKVNGIPRGTVPTECHALVASIDVHDRLLYFAVVALADGFRGAVVDWGAWPQQGSSFFSLSSCPRPLCDAYPGRVQDAYLLAGLADLTAKLLDRQYAREDGAVLKVGKLLVDAGWGDKTELVKAFCRRHPQYNAVLLPSFGAYVKPGDMLRAGRKPGGRFGPGWGIPPPEKGMVHVTFDSDWTKTQLAHRLSVPKGTPGGWDLWGTEPRAHALLGEHCTAERSVHTTRGDASKDHWELLPNQDNHLFDNLVMCFVAGLVAGVRLEGFEGAPAPRRRVKLSEVQAGRAAYGG